MSKKETKAVEQPADEPKAQPAQQEQNLTFEEIEAFNRAQEKKASR